VKLGLGARRSFRAARRHRRPSRASRPAGWSPSSSRPARTFLVDGLNKLARREMPAPPRGAFYVFLPPKHHRHEAPRRRRIAERLLNEAGRGPPLSGRRRFGAHGRGLSAVFLRQLGGEPPDPRARPACGRSFESFAGPLTRRPASVSRGQAVAAVGGPMVWLRAGVPRVVSPSMPWPSAPPHRCAAGSRALAVVETAGATAALCDGLPSPAELIDAPGVRASVFARRRPGPGHRRAPRQCDARPATRLIRDPPTRPLTHGCSPRW